MTEVQFAKQFLTTLDSKSTKYQADHFFDPKTFQTRVPYTLPKLAHPPHPLPPKISKTSASTPVPGSEPVSSAAQTTTITLTLKSTRNPTFTLHLPSLTLQTEISTLKSQIQKLISQSTSSPEVPLEKIKILYNKKPVPSTKPTIKDVIENDNADVEFGVMVIGGSADPSPTIQTIHLNTSDDTPVPTSSTKPEVKDPVVTAKDTAPEPVQPGDPSGKDILKTTEFWDDLQGFLEQRLKDQSEAEKLRAIFEKAATGL